MPVWSIDHVKLHFLPCRTERGRQLLGTRRRVEPIRTEGDEQRPGRNVADRVREPAAPMLTREIEVGESAGGVEVRVCVEAFHKGIRLVAQITLDLELGLSQAVADIVGGLQTPA